MQTKAIQEGIIKCICEPLKIHKQLETQYANQ